MSALSAQWQTDPSPRTHLQQRLQHRCRLSTRVSGHCPILPTCDECMLPGQAPLGDGGLLIENTCGETSEQRCENGREVSREDDWRGRREPSLSGRNDRARRAPATGCAIWGYPTQATTKGNPRRPATSGTGL